MIYKRATEQLRKAGMKQVEFCGAFNGTVTLRNGETIEQLHGRIESAMQSVLDRSCKRMNVAVGVDMGDLQHAFNGTKQFD